MMSWSTVGGEQWCLCRCAERAARCPYASCRAYILARRYAYCCRRECCRRQLPAAQRTVGRLQGRVSQTLRIAGGVENRLGEQRDV